MEELIETKAWQDKADLGRAYIAASSHAYGEGVLGQVETERFTASLKRMDVTVKNEDTPNTTCSAAPTSTTTTAGLSLRRRQYEARRRCRW